MPAPAYAPPVPLFPVPWRHDDFDPAVLAEAKAAAGLTVSVCLPAQDEEITVGHIVATVRRTLMEAVPLVDEVLVIDDGSTDATAAVAAWEGARVVAVADVLPEAGPGSGKGNAMWKSMDAAAGDLLCWLDADIRNFGAHFVTGLLGPLITQPEIAFVKGLSRVPLPPASMMACMRVLWLLGIVLRGQASLGVAASTLSFKGLILVTQC